MTDLCTTCGKRRSVRGLDIRLDGDTPSIQVRRSRGIDWCELFDGRLYREDPELGPLRRDECIAAEKAGETLPFRWRCQGCHLHLRASADVLPRTRSSPRPSMATNARKGPAGCRSLMSRTMIRERPT